MFNDSIAASVNRSYRSVIDLKLCYFTALLCACFVMPAHATEKQNKSSACDANKMIAYINTLSPIEARLYLWRYDGGEKSSDEIACELLVLWNEASAHENHAKIIANPAVKFMILERLLQIIPRFEKNAETEIYNGLKSEQTSIRSYSASALSSIRSRDALSHLKNIIIHDDISVALSGAAALSSLSIDGGEIQDEALSLLRKLTNDAAIKDKTLRAELQRSYDEIIERKLKNRQK